MLEKRTFIISTNLTSKARASINPPGVVGSCLSVRFRGGPITKWRTSQCWESAERRQVLSILSYCKRRGQYLANGSTVAPLHMLLHLECVQSYHPFIHNILLILVYSLSAFCPSLTHNLFGSKLQKLLKSNLRRTVWPFCLLLGARTATTRHLPITVWYFIADCLFKSDFVPISALLNNCLHFWAKLFSDFQCIRSCVFSNWKTSTPKSIERRKEVILSNYEFTYTLETGG